MERGWQLWLRFLDERSSVRKSVSLHPDLDDDFWFTYQLEFVSCLVANVYWSLLIIHDYQIYLILCCLYLQVKIYSIKIIDRMSSLKILSIEDLLPSAVSSIIILIVSVPLRNHGRCSQYDCTLCPSWYPLVNIYITMDKSPFYSWVNPLFRLGHVQ